MPVANRQSVYNDESLALTNLEDELIGTSTRRVDDLDFEIDSSTLDRAFPDFSEILTSEEEEPEMEEELTHSDLEMSVEVGRGAAHKVRDDDSRNSMMSFENSVRSSSPAMRVEYPTPQKAATRPSRRADSENLRKNAQVRRATQAQKEVMSPQVSKGHQEKRRTLSDMHSKVRDSYEGSFIEDERPAPITTKTRSARFGKPTQEIADAVERASRDAYAKETRKPRSNAGTPRKSSANANNTIGDTMTHQSFLLPDLPNISELVSGVYEDGMPVYPRQGKMRSTRFVSPLHDHTDASHAGGHVQLDAVPVPEDEKALFVHLRLLQDKVAELEQFKSDAEKRMDGYRQENASLKSNKPRQSARHEQEETQHKKGSKHLMAENQKLEDANLALQNQLDIADRKAQVQESALKRLNRDRESAINQLGAAYLEGRELKVENEELRVENEELKSHITRLSNRMSREHEQDTIESEASSDADESQTHTEPSRDMSRSTKDLTSKSDRSHTKTKRKDDSRGKVSTQVHKELSRLEKERAEDALFSIEVSSRRTSATKPKPSVSRSSESKKTRKQPNTSKQRVKRVVLEDTTEPELSQPTNGSSETGEVTLLSLIDENEISRLRRTLEEERLMRKQRRSSIPKETKPTDITNPTQHSILKNPAPRKSSLRASRPEIPRSASALGDVTTASKADDEGDSNLTVPIPERSRRHSDHSLPTPSQRKKQRNVPDMTSAFILPDITLHHVDWAASDPSKLPQETQKALDGIAQHNGKNCTVCKSHSNDCNHEAAKVPKPVPVSERMPKPSVYNEEPTMRPSQPPVVALATVLKGLEDELSHLKMQLTTCQAAYNKLDVSLGKRPRKALQERIDKLFKDIDLKADQIYSLYDVVEGQKQDGHEMTEQEMEMTLESFGIDVNQADITGTTDKFSRDGNVDLDEEEDLPWEGIESTAEMTGQLH